MSKLLSGPSYPDKEFYSLTAIIHHLGYTAPFTAEDPFDLAMVWEDATWVEPPPAFLEIARHKPVLNMRCTDISKRRLEEVFRQVFGYASFVDPTTYQGRCIRKPDENAVRDGRVLDCPVAGREEGMVDQRLIDAEVDGIQEELRTSVILGEIPQVKIFHKRFAQRRWLSTTLAEPEAVFSADERHRILEVCARLGLDFGELDILRSRSEGKLYILDANKTPAGYGMRNRILWQPGQREKSLVVLAECFDRRVGELVAEMGES